VRSFREGATLVYLPPYSPDFNPIEMAFQAHVAPAKSSPLTVARLWDALGDLLHRFMPQECINYLASAGLSVFA
jgi:transposase